MLNIREIDNDKRDWNELDARERYLRAERFVYTHQEFLNDKDRAMEYTIRILENAHPIQDNETYEQWVERIFLPFITPLIGEKEAAQFLTDYLESVKQINPLL